MKYNGYLIVTDPDYIEMTDKGEIVDDLWCGVYDESDIEQEHMLGDFNLVREASFKKSSAEAIEKAIMEVVEEDMNSYELVRKTNELNRMKVLFSNAVEYISETSGQDDITCILKNTLGMTYNEIENMLPDMRNEIENGMQMQ